jgi:hypothetical protein
MAEMTLRQAIEHLDERLGDTSRDWGCEECRREHEQLRAWLVELEQMKESGAVLVVRCKDCKFYEPATSDSGNCSKVLECTAYANDFCSYAERRDPSNEP